MLTTVIPSLGERGGNVAHTVLPSWERGGNVAHTVLHPLVKEGGNVAHTVLHPLVKKEENVAHTVLHLWDRKEGMWHIQSSTFGTGRRECGTYCPPIFGERLGMWHILSSHLWREGEVYAVNAANPATERRSAQR